MYPPPGALAADQLDALRFRAMFEYSPFAIRIFGPDGATRYINQEYTSLSGISLEQLQAGEPNVLHSERLRATGLMPYLEQAFGGEPVTMPPLLYTTSALPNIRGGRPHWLRTVILPVKDGAGQLHEVIAMFEDITAQKEAEELLEQRVQERTRELSTLLEVSHNIASMLDLDLLLRLTLDQLKNVVDYHASAIFILEGKDRLRLLHYQGPMPQERLERQWLLETARHSREVIYSQAPVIIADVLADTALARAFRAVAIEQHQNVPDYIASWMGVPLIHRKRVIGMLAFDHNERSYYTAHHAELALAFANQAATAIENASLFEQAQGLAAIIERQRLARELHDSVSQVLYSIALGARTARTLLDRDPARVAEPLDYVLSLADAGLAEMRALIFELRPESLATEGLVAALQKQAAALHARHTIQVEIDLCPEPDLPLEAKEALYRIAQEALHNTTKHARATQVTLGLRATPQWVTLTIQDNGVGFDSSGTFPGHLGLHSMRERMARLGGVLKLESAPGAGVQISAKVPHHRDEI